VLGQSTNQRPARRVSYAELAARVPAAWLLFCGLLAFALYITADVVASLSYDGYSYRDQTISELSAIGAPTRGPWLVMGVAWEFLSLGLAIGVLRVAGRRRAVRIVGWVFLVSAAVGTLWWFAPMHQREVLAADGGDWRDTMHLAMGGVSSLEYFLMIGVGAFAFGRLFRWYSFATIAAMLVFGTLMNTMVGDVANDDPTPWLGIWERITVEGAMLWQAVFAAVLLWGQRSSGPGAAPPNRQARPPRRQGRPVRDSLRGTSASASD